MNLHSFLLLSQDGNSALYYAEMYSKTEYVEMLRAAGANDSLLCQVPSPGGTVDSSVDGSVDSTSGGTVESTFKDPLREFTVVELRQRILQLERSVADRSLQRDDGERGNACLFEFILLRIIIVSVVCRNSSMHSSW